MAFPTTIGNFVIRGCGGPFLSSGGNVYVIGTAPGDTSKLSAYKATDPTSSFSNVGTDFQMTSTNGIASLAAYQVGDDIHVATHDSASATTNEIRYHIFSMSSDTWTTTNESVKGTYDVGPGYTGAIGIGLRSDGDVIILYQGPKVANMGSDRSRDYYARRESAVWTIDVLVDNGGATNWHVGGVVVGSSDRMHFFFRDNGAADSYQRTLTSANALETFPASFDASSSTSADAIAFRGASYFLDPNTKVFFPYSDSTGTTENSAKCDSADAPTMSIDVDITGATNVTVSNSGASFATNGVTLWNAFVGFNDGDIYTNSNTIGSGWTTPASFYTGTVTRVYTNVYTRNGDVVLAMVFDETNTKYHEKVLLAGDVGPNFCDFEMDFGARGRRR